MSNIHNGHLNGECKPNPSRPAGWLSGPKGSLSFQAPANGLQSNGVIMAHGCLYNINSKKVNPSVCRLSLKRVN